MIFNVHAGHNPDGKIACGAIGYLKESTENRKIKDEVIRLLRLLGHTVYDCTVDDGINENDNLAKIVQKCNAHKVDVDLSIHLNAAAKKVKDGKTTGVESYVYSMNSASVPYATRITNAIAELGFTNRGVQAKQFYVIRKTNAPAVLVECLFCDDPDDVAIYDYKSIAEAIVFGLTGEKYVPVVTAPTPDDIDKTVEEPTNNGEFYRVQVGAYTVKGNAYRMRDKLKELGFDAIIVKA